MPKRKLLLSASVSIFRKRLPRYQFTAWEVRTRVRFTAYAHERSFLSGCAFLLLVVSLRSLGVQGKLLFQTDNGAEFGGWENWRKRLLRQRYIFDPLGVTLLSIPPPERTVNTFGERSHRSDDEECYALKLGETTTKPTFLRMAQKWILTSSFRPPHFGREMRGRTPMRVLPLPAKRCASCLGAFPVLLIDRVIPHLQILWDISGIPWDNSPNKGTWERNPGSLRSVVFKNDFMERKKRLPQEEPFLYGISVRIFLACFG